METKLEWYYSTPDEQDKELHRIQYESVRDFYANRGYDVQYREWREGEYWRFHIIVYDFPTKAERNGW